MKWMLTDFLSIKLYSLLYFNYFHIMKKLTSFAIFCFFMVNANAQNLSAHQWKNRIILVLVNDAAPAELQTQLTEFRTHSEGMKERKLVVYQVQANQFQRGLSPENEWIVSNKLYQKYKSDDASFEVVLIGLDGGIKLTQSDLLTCEKLFAIIDGMPMRRREMRDTKQEK